MSNEDTGVHVTLESIYLKLLDMDKKLDPLPAQAQDHETRLRALERNLWLAVGAASIGGGALGQIIPGLIGS